MSRLDDPINEFNSIEQEMISSSEVEELKAKLKAGIKALFLELIGENEDTTVESGHKYPSKYKQGRNYLRNDLRQKVEEL